MEDQLRVVKSQVFLLYNNHIKSLFFSLLIKLENVEDLGLGGHSHGGGGGAGVQEGNVEADLIDPWPSSTGLRVPIYSGSLDWPLPLPGGWPLLGDPPCLAPDL